MTHLLLFRSCKNYVFSKTASYGTHQIIERNISQRKYALNGVRKGYNIPFATEWRIVEYRLKKEVIPEFVNDLKCINLNPHPNNMTLYQIFTKKIGKNRKVTVGKLFSIIQWLFKWINKKKITCVILTILSILTLQFWLILIAIIIYMNPIKPVPIAADGKKNDFRNGNWSYDFIIGTLNDCGEPMGKEYYQEDVL